MTLFFHDLYSHVKNHPLIAQFYSFTKNVLQNINFTFLHKLNFNVKVFILPPHHLLFWRWSFGKDLMFFRLLFVEWLHFVDGPSLVLWFIFSLGEFVSSYLLCDLYSRLGNLYHFAYCMIYIPTWGICIICCWKDSLTLFHFGPSWGHVDICIK